MFRTVLALLKWAVTLGVLGALLWLGHEIHEKLRTGEAGEKPDSQLRASEKSSDRTLKFSEASAQAHNLKYSPAEEVEWREQVTVYGRVVPNPAATMTVQAPVAGTLRSDWRWSVPGQRVRAGQVLGQIEIRVGRLEQLDLQAKLADAQIRRKRAEEVCDRRRELVKRQAQASPATVTQLQKEEAEVQLSEAELQLDTARAAVALLQKALDEIEQRNGPRLPELVPSLFGAAPQAGFPGPIPWAALAWGTQEPSGLSWSLFLTAPTDGEVTEVGGQPGTAVEAGGLVFRLVDFHRCRVRLDLPPALLTAGPPGEVDLFALTPPPAVLAGATNQSEGAKPGPAVSARLLGQAPEVDLASQYARYWYEVDFRPRSSEGPRPVSEPELRDGVSWRPGLFVRTQLPAPQAAAQPAMAVPIGSVLFHQGRALVYVRTEPGKFQRREVRILGRHGNRCFLAPRDIVFGDEKVGVDAAELVVSEQAQLLLSEEFRSEIDND
jgi:biotin carboxyl carrier protein